MSDFDSLCVKNAPSDWALALMSKGVIVDIKISYYRGTERLLPFDVGWKQDLSREEKEHIKLGVKNILPSEFTKEIAQIEGMARKNLSFYSHKTLWGQFVPYITFNTWYNKHKEIQSLFEEFKSATYDKYDLIVQHSRSIYRELACKVWQKNYEGEPTESFISDYIYKTLKLFPERDKLCNSMSMNIDYFQIPLPSFLSENIVIADQHIRDNEIKNAEHQLTLQSKELINSYYVSKKQQMIDSFLNDTVLDLRKYVYEYCQNILEFLNKKDEKVQLSVFQKEGLIKTIEKFEHLNFYNDKEIDSKLNQLRTELIKPGRDCDGEKIKFHLEEILNKSSEDFDPFQNKTIASSIDI